MYSSSNNDNNNTSEKKKTRKNYGNLYTPAAAVASA